MTPGPIVQKQKPSEHLDDLRKAIVNSLIAVGAASAAAWLVSNRLVDWLLEPAKRVVEGPLYFFAPSDAFMIRVQVSVAAGLIIAFPVVAHQVWRFVSPALHDGEKKAVLPWAAATAALFAVGILFGYCFILPTSLQFTMSFATGSLQPMLSVREYLSFAVDLVLASGVAFDFPVVVVGAAAMGLVRPATLGRFRRHAYVAILVVAAILTPPDVASQLLLGLPMLVLFESSLFVARLFEKNKKK